ncbi:MAG: diphthamide biosynthesis enzyme Dph2 [Euryarchaeota archaeon]|nr:diphthamide biosynthesis enzyme Dph2 [Euryarchaeota archaeon]|tara:strand:- start:1 stop:1005 length:1005 start_codon:yes stop_codon:yes gene_type:complete
MSEITFDWESGIDEVCSKLKDKKLIGIQVPDGLKVKSHTITKKIKDLTGANVILWGEPTYGACDLADRPLEEVGADALIHLGHMPMPYHSDFYAIPTYFVPVKHTGKLNLGEKSIEEIQEMLPNKIGIVTTAQHLHMIDEATEKLEHVGFDASVTKGGPRLAAAGQLLGCNSSSARRLKVDGYLYIGTGLFHPLTVALSTGKRVACIDPHNGKVSEADPKPFLKQRYAAISVAKNAKRWAVLFSNQIGQKRIELAEKMSKSLEDAGKEVIMVGSIHQSHEQLLGMGIDAAVITACPRLAIEDGPTWPMPLLTVPEAQIVLGRIKPDPYPFDEFA